jgi:hypothetical protein
MSSDVREESQAFESVMYVGADNSLFRYHQPKATNEDPEKKIRSLEKRLASYLEGASAVYALQERYKMFLDKDGEKEDSYKVMN